MRPGPGASAASPTFQAAQAGPFVSQAVYLYATVSQGARAFSRLARPGLLRCVADSVIANSTAGVRFVVTRRQLRALAVGGVRTAGYRVTATANTSGGSVTTYVDLLLLGSGRALSALSLAAFAAPLTRAFELRLERIVAHRLDHAAGV